MQPLEPFAFDMDSMYDWEGIAHLTRRLEELVCEPTESEERDDVYHTRVHTLFGRCVFDSMLIIYSAGHTRLNPESRIFGSILFEHGHATCDSTACSQDSSSSTPHGYVDRSSILRGGRSRTSVDAVGTSIAAVNEGFPVANFDTGATTDTGSDESVYNQLASEGDDQNGLRYAGNTSVRLSVHGRLSEC